MNVVDYISSLSDFIQFVSPDSTVIKQNVPKDPSPNTFITRVQKNTRSLETGYHSLVELEFQVVYYGADILDTLNKIESVSQVIFDNHIMIPINGTNSYMTIDSFSYSEPVKNVNNVDMVLGILTAEVREARSSLANQTQPAIKNFNITVN